MNRVRSGSPSSYVSSSSEDDFNLGEKERKDQQHLRSRITPVDPSVLKDVEEQAKIASRSIGKMMSFLTKELGKGTNTTLDIVSVYDGAINNVHSEVEQNIKAMYGLIAKCEELDRKMKPLNELATQVRTIRETLDLLEDACNK